MGQRGDSSGRLGGQIGRDTAGLLRKIGTGEKQRRKRDRKERREGNRGEFFAAHRDFAPKDLFRFDHPPLKTLHFYCHLLLVTDVWDAHFSFTV